MRHTNHERDPQIRVAIACGGTGGHLFPGLAVARDLCARGCEILLLISEKEVDQVAARAAEGMHVVSLPAAGLTRGAALSFLRGFTRSLMEVRRTFAQLPPHAVLAMGGFTSAPPIVAGRVRRLPTFVHESNSIPGRANRWLGRVVREAFVGFPEAARRMPCRRVTVTGTPVRPEFCPCDPARSRVALGLDPARPVLLITGGSQGASAINQLVVDIAPALHSSVSNLQFLHLTGANDVSRVRVEYSRLGIAAVVHDFCSAMEVAMDAATVALSRAGASSLAELAAMRLPAVLIPYPAAVDNHQLSNARALERFGGAKLIEQSTATREKLTLMLVELLESESLRQRMGAALGRWHHPDAPRLIGDAILESVRRCLPSGARSVTAGRRHLLPVA